MTDSGYQIDLFMSWIVIMLIKLILRCALKLCTDTNHHIGSNWDTEALVRLKCIRISCASNGRQIVFGDHLRALGFECRLRHVTGDVLSWRHSCWTCATCQLHSCAASTFSSCAASLQRRANSAGELEIVRGGLRPRQRSQLLVFRVLVGCTDPVFTRSSCWGVNHQRVRCKTLTEPLLSYELKKVHLFV